MNGLSVNFDIFKSLVRVFVVAAFVDEVDVWSLSHLALALSALNLLVAICTFAF